MTTAGTVTRADWINAIDGVIEAARSSKAVHRPILVLLLLSRAKARRPGEVGFAEVDRSLAPVLQEMGRAKKAEPLLPFWHLQTAPFWTVVGADDLERREGKDRPTRRALLAGNVRGVVRQEWWRALLDSPALVDELVARLVAGAWPDVADQKRVAALLRM